MTYNCLAYVNRTHRVQGSIPVKAAEGACCIDSFTRTLGVHILAEYHKAPWFCSKSQVVTNKGYSGACRESLPRWHLGSLVGLGQEAPSGPGLNENQTASLVSSLNLSKILKSPHGEKGSGLENTNWFTTDCRGNLKRPDLVERYTSQ